MLRNVGSNWVLTILTVVVSYVLTPYVLHALGKEGYGTWTLVNAMTGYIGLAALGVPMACVRYLAQHVSLKQWPEANQVIATCAGLYLMLGAVALLIGGGFSAAFMYYDIPPSYRFDADIAFGMMILYVALSFFTYLPEGIMYAHHDFVPRNLVRIAGVILRLVLTLTLLRLHPSLAFLAAIQLIGLAFDFFTSLAIIRLRYSKIRIDFRLFDWVMLRRVLSFSLFVLLLAAGARLSFETDALVIGAMLGIAAIPAYTFANSLIVYLVEFIVGIAAVVTPMATALSSQQKDEELREMFLKWSKGAVSITIAAGLFLIVLGPRFIGWWVGPEFEDSSGAVLQVLTLSCFVFMPARGVAVPILMGLGIVRPPTIGFLFAGVMNLIMSALLARPYGLTGVAIGTAVPNVLYAVYVIVVTCRVLHLTPFAYARYVIPRAAVGALPMAALLIWFKAVFDVSTLPGLAAAGLTMVVAFGIVWVLFVYRDDPYVDVWSPLGRFLGVARS